MRRLVDAFYADLRSSAMGAAPLGVSVVPRCDLVGRVHPVRTLLAGLRAPHDGASPEVTAGCGLEWPSSVWSW
jgi:hypothetical protein